MIANLITTVLLALGVATGNVSSNSYKGGNAFNHEIKESQQQPKKRVTTPIEIEVTEFYTAQYYTGNTILDAEKYYLGTENNSNYFEEGLNIRNTIYTYTKLENYGGQQMYTYFYMVMAITPTLDIDQTDVRLVVDVKYTTTYAHTIYRSFQSFETNSNLENLMDITLNDNIKNTIASVYGTLPKTNYTSTGTLSEQTPSGTHIVIDDAYIGYEHDIEIDRNQTKYIYMECWYANNELEEINVEPNTFRATATGTLTEINYEVVDVAGLMYTILTLPFSFFSTAFNLTIFPNTPYAVNFGNVILTIIAALTLLYIIKKVIK